MCPKPCKTPCAANPWTWATRAWTMVRFFDAKMLQTSCCKECGGEFISHAFDPTRGYVCGLCHMPARPFFPLLVTEVIAKSLE